MDCMPRCSIYKNHGINKRDEVINDNQVYFYD